MRILILAPQPFYEERGTPIAMRMLTDTLCTEGHNVDFLTYHVGHNINIPNCRIIRSRKLFFISKIPIGFSFRKIICDIFLAFSFIYLMRRNKYDVIHSSEETIFLALILRPFHKAKIIYDMDSSIPDQLLEKWKWLKIFKPIFYAIEKVAIKKCDVVVPVCKSLEERASMFKMKSKIVLLEDCALPAVKKRQKVDQIREQLGLNGLLCMYVGNLEHYQGADLLISAFTKIDSDAKVHLVIIGGKPEEIQIYNNTIRKLNIGDRVHLVGSRPVSLLSYYLSQADILVSPRTKGVNTPMKIFSYLDSGKPIIATDILSHTQVLNSESAMLVSPTSESLAAGISELTRNQDLRCYLGNNGKLLSDKCYSYSRFQETVSRLYALSGPLFC